MASAAHVSVGTALAASSLLGVAVRTGRLELGAWRWLHHALYAVSVLTAANATVIDAARGRSTWPAAATALGVLAVLPATKGGSNAHVAVAVAASTVYVAGTIAASPRRRASAIVSAGG
jgi:predicted ferric reductase